MRFIDCINITGESCKAYDGNKEYISTGAVDVDHIDQNQIEIVSYDSKPSRANLITNDRSILFAKMQGTKKVLLINQELEKNIYSTGFFSVSPKNNVLNKKCLYHLLGSKTFLSQKDKYCSGATQKAITLEGLKKIEITVPELEKQDQIAKILDTIKSILESYKKELENYDLLVRARFVEMFGNVPEEERVTIAEICKIITDGTHQPPKFTNTGIPFLFVSNIITNEICYDAEKFISEETYTELIKRTPIEIGDILLSTVGSYGHPAIVKTDRRFCFQRHIAYLKPKSDMVNSEYLRGAILSDNVQRQIDERVKGIAQKTLNLAEIRKIRLPLPPLKLQEQFADFVKQVDKSKLAVQKSLEKTQQLFDSLMQEYFG